MQLPFIVDTLKIDVRQIMRLELFGNRYSGLRQAMVCVSFLDPETEAECPEDAIAKLWNAPTTFPSDHSSFLYEGLRNRLIQFFLLAPKPVRARFLKESAQAMRHNDNTSEKLRHEANVGGCLYRASFDAGPPSIGEWRNTLLHCSERLRRHFSPERLERLTFTSIPSTDDEYKVEAEFLFPKIPRVYRERSELCFRSRPRPIRKVSGVISFQAEPIVRPEQKLSPPEKLALDKFDELDSRERLQLWNKHLSKFYK